MARFQQEIDQTRLTSRKTKKTRADVPPFDQWFLQVFADFLTSPSSDYQLESLKELNDFHLNRGQRRIRLEPRGFAKTLRSQAYVCYCIGYKLEEFILWISNTGGTDGQATDCLSTIKTVIEDNEKFAELCPDATGIGPVWRQGRIITNNGVRVDAAGIMQNIRGRRRGKSRPGLVVGDDLQVTEQLESGALRRKTNNRWNRDIMYVGLPTTNYLVTDTAIHPEAVSYMLATKTSGWDSKINGAFIIEKDRTHWPINMHLWKEWKDILLDHSKDSKESLAEAKQFYFTHETEMNEGAKLFWPQRFPLYDLMLRWAESGDAAFNSEYLNNPADPSRCRWSADCFDHKNIFFDDWPVSLAMKTVGGDAGLGKHDYSANVFLGVAPEYSADGLLGMLYVDADLETDDPKSMCKRMVQYFRNGWVPDGIHLESMQFQSLIKPDLENELLINSMHVDVYADMDTTKKEVRIFRLGKYVTTRRIRFKRRSKGALLLLEQLRYTPTSEFDDGPDALEKAERLAGMLL